MIYEPMPDTDGGSDFSLVEFYAYGGKPSCREHGAMNKVSESPPGYWRCIALAGAKKNPCRAGCMEANEPPARPWGSWGRQAGDMLDGDWRNSGIA